MNRKDKYQLQFGDELSLVETEELVQDLDLDTVDIGYTGGVTGCVVDETNTVVAGATVKIFDNNFKPIKHTMTDENGQYNLSSLEPGTYTCHAIKDGYSLSQKITVSINDTFVTLNDIIITKNLVISNGILYGIVYNKYNVPLGDVEVVLSKIVDGEEEVVSRTLSARDGEYVIYDLDAGIYQLYASSEDYYLDDKIDVVITLNANTKEYLYLTKSNNAKEGTINGIIRDKKTLTPLSNACVCLYTIDEESEESLVSMTFTNRDGKYFFGYVPEGRYIVKSKVSQE
ncbi:carboxypeptidase-like regulatory domain-containing protein [Tannockella kyphosi]|uniref:carboxypeptidase-like regulatory domain-containing protein n=1 Tax=Tannockella kyphosi TaxID=2899121 RepID=UPI002011C194|nr:carboxypeptidase-like regulatory domain-containing protein [Tannockella kyphosi]